MSDRDVDPGEQYRLPAVELPESLGTTFLAQRYDPLRLPPMPPVGIGATEQIFNNMEEMALADIAPALLPNVAFPPAHAVLQNLYQTIGTVGHSVKHWITAFLTATKDAIGDGIRRIRDAAQRAIWQLTEVARGMVPERMPIARVTLDGP